jgi:tRNA-dihydrouridine synthase
LDIFTGYLDSGLNIPPPKWEEVKKMILRHGALLIEYKGEYIGMREMRKHVAWYTSGYPRSAKLRNRINEIETMGDLESLMEEYLSNW